MPRRNARYQVFISHSSRDRWICEQLQEKIRSLGANCWLDAIDLKVGEPVPASVLQALKASDECLVLLSPSSKLSEWVKFEIGMAMMAELFIVPVMLHVDREELPAAIRELKPIDLNDFDLYLPQLAKRVRLKAKRSRRR